MITDAASKSKAGLHALPSGEEENSEARLKSKQKAHSRGTYIPLENPPTLFVKEPKPAPGYRYHTNGALGSVGNYGFSWSSATSGINGLDLHFYSQYLNASHGDGRGHGFQLRCLSE